MHERCTRQQLNSPRHSKALLCQQPHRVSRRVERHDLRVEVERRRGLAGKDKIERLQMRKQRELCVVAFADERVDRPDVTRDQVECVRSKVPRLLRSHGRPCKAECPELQLPEDDGVIRDPTLPSGEEDAEDMAVADE